MFSSLGYPHQAQYPLWTHYVQVDSAAWFLRPRDVRVAPVGKLVILAVTVAMRCVYTGI